MKAILYFVLLTICFVACKEQYDILLPPSQTGFLVVEGFINLDGKTEIRLSKTTPLKEKGRDFQKNAVLQIEADDNTIYPLLEEDSGRYVSENLQLDLNRKYRLHIRTESNSEYVSTFENPVPTPEIDSLTWIRYNGGVEIYVNTRDATNTTNYYRWEYDETWEFKSPLFSTVYLRTSMGPNGREAELLFWYPSRKHNDTMFTCWKSRSSSSINLGTTERLGQSRIYSPIIYYPGGSWEMSFLYSVNVRQYGLNRQAYDFFSRIKKNTESLGSIFDAQPSEVKGNIKNVTDDKELVLGYISVGSVTEKRIFIANTELEGWNYRHECFDDIQVVQNQKDSLMIALGNGANLPSTASEVDNNSPIVPVPIISAYYAAPDCVDCRLRGSPVKPSFWP